MNYERSFECACKWLDLDAATERERLLAEIDAELDAALKRYVRSTIQWRRAAVLTCAGVAVLIDGQHQLPLVSQLDYDQVAGVEHGDPPPRKSGKGSMPRLRQTA